MAPTAIRKSEPPKVISLALPARTRAETDSTHVRGRLLLLLAALFLVLLLRLRLLGLGLLRGRGVPVLGLQRVDPLVARQIDPFAVGNDGVVGAVAEAEDFVSIRGVEAGRLGRVEVGDVDGLADQAPGADHGPAGVGRPALAARAGVQ